MCDRVSRRVYLNRTSLSNSPQAQALAGGSNDMWFGADVHWDECLGYPVCRITVARQTWLWQTNSIRSTVSGGFVVVNAGDSVRQSALLFPQPIVPHPRFALVDAGIVFPPSHWASLRAAR